MGRLLAAAAVALAALVGAQHASSSLLSETLAPRVGAPTRCANLDGWITMEILSSPTRARLSRAVCGPLSDALRRPIRSARSTRAALLSWAAFEAAVAGGLVATNGEEAGSSVCWAGRHYLRFVRPFARSWLAARRVVRHRIRQTDAPRACWPSWAG